MQDTFLEYGVEFQQKLIHIILTDTKYLSQIYDTIREEYFDSPVHRWIISKSKSYFEVYYGSPSRSMFEYETSQMTNIRDRDDTNTELRYIYSLLESSDFQYVRDATALFCRQQELKNAINESIDFLQLGDYDAIETRIIEAVQKSIGGETVYDYRTQIVDRYADVYRNPIGTGWDVIDNILDGGLGAGDLGVIVGPGGSGKSWVLQHLTANAFKRGKHVLYITLELNANYVARRIDGILTHMPSNLLPDNVTEIHDEFSKYSGKLSIEWFPEDTLSIVGLRSILDKMKYNGNAPDIVMIDYADLMQLANNNKKRHDQLLKDLYQQIRKIAGVVQIPIWTASQTNRDSMEDEIIDANKLADSMGKHYTADFMMSLTRRESDVRANKALFYVVKNRYGQDKKQYVADMNTVNGTLNIYNQQSMRGVATRAKIDEAADSHSMDSIKNVQNLLLSKKIIPIHGNDNT